MSRLDEIATPVRRTAGPRKYRGPRMPFPFVVHRSLAQVWRTKALIEKSEREGLLTIEREELAFLRWLAERSA